MSAPPPIPQSPSTRRIIGRALVWTALSPLNMAVATLLPPEWQWTPVMISVGLVTLVPFAHFILGVAAFVRREPRLGWIYVAVALGSAALGAGATVAVMKVLSP